ncbi:MAG: hypothetical protein MR790_07595 [Clostridiales bacterium]|nr:hypothetical protein [Clostridiales bacterium]
MGLFDFALTITPSIVAIIAVIVPAIQNVKIRKIESKERERDNRILSLTNNYSDFCEAFTQFKLDSSNKNAIKVAESAFKLSAMCDEGGAYMLICFAEDALDGFKNVESYTLKEMFEQCAKIVRKSLKQEDT